VKHARIVSKAMVFLTSAKYPKRQYCNSLLSSEQTAKIDQYSDFAITNAATTFL